MFYKQFQQGLYSDQTQQQNSLNINNMNCIKLPKKDHFGYFHMVNSETKPLVGNIDNLSYIRNYKTKPLDLQKSEIESEIDLAIEQVSRDIKAHLINNTTYKDAGNLGFQQYIIDMYEKGFFHTYQGLTCYEDGSIKERVDDESKKMLQNCTSQYSQVIKTHSFYRFSSLVDKNKVAINLKIARLAELPYVKKQGKEIQFTHPILQKSPQQIEHLKYEQHIDHISYKQIAWAIKLVSIDIYNYRATASRKRKILYADFCKQILKIYQSGWFKRYQKTS